MVRRRTHNILHTPERIRRRRLQKMRIGVGFVLVVIMVLSVFVWFSHYDGYEIDSIVVSGNNVLTDEEVTGTTREALAGSYAFLFSKQHIFIFPRFALADTLRRTYPRIKELDIDISGRREITVTLSERSPHALWCHSVMATVYISVLDIQTDADTRPPCYFLDSNGYAFARAPDFSGAVYMTMYSDISTGTEHVGTQAFSQETFNALNAFYDRFAKEGFTALGILKRAGNDYWLILEGGGYIKFDAAHDPAKVVADVALAVATKQKEHEAFRTRLLYIDARFDDRNRIYFQFSNP